MFKKASRSQVFIKLAITGPTGSGKTFSALRLATGLIGDTGKRIAFIDTENDSASLYSDKFDFDTVTIEPPFEHDKFSKAILAAADAGYGVLVIDSASHFWEGILEFKAKLDARPGTNSYTNWNEAGRKFSDILHPLLQSKIHVIVCLRSKMDYVMEQNERGKMQPRKIGLAPIMRDGVEYEFTTVFDVALNHECAVSKDRSGLFTDKVFQITEDTGKQIATWLSTATPKQNPVIQDPPVPPGTNITKWHGVMCLVSEKAAGDGTKYWEISASNPADTSNVRKCGTMEKAKADAVKGFTDAGKLCDLSVAPGRKPDTWMLVEAEEHDNLPM